MCCDPYVPVRGVSAGVVRYVDGVGRLVEPPSGGGVVLCEYSARFNPVLHSIFRIAHGLVFASCIIACRFVESLAQRNIRCPFWLKATSLVNA